MKGKMEYPNGGKFEGNYVNGLKSGKGTLHIIMEINMLMILKIIKKKVLENFISLIKGIMMVNLKMIKFYILKKF